MSYPSGGDATLKADRTTIDSKLHHKSLVWIEGGEGWLLGSGDDRLRLERRECVLVLEEDLSEFSSVIYFKKIIK